MSHRYAHTQTVVLLMVIAVGSSAMARQAPRQNATPAQPPAPAAQGNAGLNFSQMPTPVVGQPYRFSLCTGALLAPGAVSMPCGRTTFRLENGSFLPPGLTLDGFGVISGTTKVDVSKLNVRICAIQIGGYGSNFLCQGQPIGFAGGKGVVLLPPPPAPVTPVTPGGGGGGGMAGGIKAIAAVTTLAGGAAYAYSALKPKDVCTEPSQANFNTCVQTRSCSSCAAYLAEMVPYCDCVEKQESAAAGVGAACRAAADAAQEAARFCLAPTPSTKLPKPAARR